MPDNPRTLAELDALYADNNAGAISAQDLRDGFHSVADPVAGGGFPPPAPAPYSFESAFYGSRAATLAVPNATQTLMGPLDGSDLYDPAGYLQSDPYVSTLEPGTYGSLEWFRVPVGIWNLQTAVQWANLTGTYRVASPGVIDDRGLLEGVDPYLYEPNFSEYFGAGVTQTPSSIPPAGRIQASNLTLIVTPAMVAASDSQSNAGDGWAMASGFLQQDSGAACNVTLANVYLTRIGAFA